MSISEVNLDDYVLAYNEETDETGYYPVVSIWIHEDSVTVYLTIEGEIIETTPDHPFYNVEERWVSAGDLKIGDEIRRADWGTGTVEAIEFILRPQFMYNLTVATAHTYFIGNSQWLVHNQCGDRGIYDQLNNGDWVDGAGAFDLALDFLGDYTQIDPDVFRSNNPVDFDVYGNPIYAQVHMTVSDLTGAHMEYSHMNFELVMPTSRGWRHFGNKHIYITDY